MVLADPRVAAVAGCVFLGVMATILPILLLAAVWSGKKYRRDAAYRVLQLIVRP
jgi:hypothetical protein